MKRAVILPVICCLFMSCNGVNEIVPAVDSRVGEPIHLGAPEVGQVSTYVKYEMNCAADSTFRYTGDTLVMRVVGENSQLYIAEWITAGSSSFESGPEQIITYPIQSKNGVVTITDRLESQLFYFYGSDNIFLTPPVRTPLFQSNCWLRNDKQIFTGDDIGHVDAFKVGPIAIEDKTAVSCVPVLSFKLDAYLFYDSTQLYLSHQVVTERHDENIVGGTVTGWQLVVK